MELKDITCNFKYAKKLKKLGVDQAKSFAVFHSGEEKIPVTFDEANNDFCGTLFDKGREATDSYTSAFTSDELLEMLPRRIKHNFNDHSSYYFLMGHESQKNIPLVWYEDNDLSGSEETLIAIADKKLSNALAKLLIWLVENKHLYFGSKDILLPKNQYKSSKEIPSGRTIFKRIPKYFYSFKYNFWIRVSPPYSVSGSDMLWRSFSNKETGVQIDECGDSTVSRLKALTLKYINNEKLF